MQTPATRVVRRGASHVRELSVCRLEVELPSGEQLTARIDRPVFRIGAHESNDLVLADPTVSQHHLEIHVTPEGYLLSDLGSSNGTLAGNMRIGGLTVIEPVELRLGETRLRVVPGADTVDVPAAADERFGELVGRSPLMRELFEQLGRLAESDCSVLLEAETGSGKEAVARALHQKSARADRPFVVVKCAGLHHDLMEDELFGHMRGAFTGADVDRAGVLETASRGTLFLDEIGELPAPLQPKLLGALERRKVRRLGSQSTRAIDVRVIASSQRNLAREVNEGRFRADLFYRVAVVRLRIPPLRERLEDIPLLVNGFLEQARARGISDVPPSLSAVALARLGAQPWPGNVRELGNAIERIVLQIASEERDEPRSGGNFFSEREQVLATFERNYFRRALATHAGNLSAVARATGLDRRYLQRILSRLGLREGA
jgi:two-component system, NtrC family, response regulator GlrR